MIGQRGNAETRALPVSMAALLAAMTAVALTPVLSGGGAPPEPPQVLPAATVPVPKPAPSAGAAATPRTFTVVGSGDVLLHNGLWKQAQRDAGGHGYDFAPMLRGVRPVIESADLAICHLETPLGTARGPFTGYPTFKVPPQIVPALKQTGYDACSTASNHSLDGGAAGIRRTLDVLDAAGIRHTGMARSRAEQSVPQIMTVRGVRVALLSYSFSFNGIPRPKGKEWLVNYLEPKRVQQAARRARAAGAEVVIVSIHWGTEYQHRPNSQQVSVAKQLLGDGAIDLILGHHAHVVQPFERINGRWVAYGMGNHISYQGFSNETRDGVISRFTFTETAPGRFTVTRVAALPTFMQLNDGPARLLLVSACPAVRQPACRASGARSYRVLRSRGAGSAGLAVLR
ncbi:CapA family protein [Catellatospora sp. NPDC049609]|uniref:CapA family protein n=1 Tax=Catellatospora sp. NPDC049609 TaxID=3155505 RepID=UPI00342E3849